MSTLSRKSLWVMRHGRPDLPPNPFLMDRHQFNRFLTAYDDAGLSTEETRRLTDRYRSIPTPNRIIASDLPRAQETAKILSRGSQPIITEPLLREIPVWLPDTSSMFLNGRWPTEMWWNYLRFHWFLDAEPEGRHKSLARAREAIALIEHHQAEAQNLAVVSHAGFLMAIITILHARGAIRGRRLPRIQFGYPNHYTWR